jgi:hypothetical protein
MKPTIACAEGHQTHGQLLGHVHWLRAYCRDNARAQRCIIRLRGKLYVSTYD